MREWKFENGIEVYEVSFNGDLHEFKVYECDRYLGTITPDSIESMENCIKDLGNGVDPVTGCWEDGMGNLCVLDGWGNE